MKQYGLHGYLMANPGMGEQLAHVLLEAAKILASADGCFLYMVSIDSQNKDCIWVTERWSSREAHDNSLKMPKVQALIKNAVPLLGEMPKKGVSMEVLGGVGVE